MPCILRQLFVQYEGLKMSNAETTPVNTPEIDRNLLKAIEQGRQGRDLFRTKAAQQEQERLALRLVINS